MKGLKKLFTIIMAAAMFLAVIGTTAQAAPGVPETTEVTIHKVVGTEFTLKAHDGRLLTPTEIAALGTNAVINNNGVEFTLWKVPTGTAVTEFDGKTDAEVTASELTGPPITVAAGTAINLGTGSYYVRETMRPATLEGSLGVPFVLELPVLNVAGTDYTLTSTGIAGGSFTVAFTADGLDKLAANRPADETAKDLEISFDARINANAVMGEDIYNNAILEYSNGYMTEDEEAEVPNPPKVYTGGRQFIKVDNVTGEFEEALSSATFVVKNSAGKYMLKENNVVSWVDDIEDATEIMVDGDNGSFEVTGLAYGNYTLVEVYVPSGYVKMADLPFEISATSYGNPLSLEDNTEEVNVKRPIIPQTGGMGTTIFLAAGAES